PSSTSVGGSPYTVTASGGESGNPVELTIDGASKSVCALSGNSSGSTVSFQGAGTCTIDANQAGNEKYEPAPEAKQSFTVAKDAQAIEFTSVPPSNATVGGSTYTVTAAASSGEPVTLTIDAASASVCKLSGSMSGSIVSFIGTGTCTIDANQAGNETYEPAPQAQQSFAVASAAGSSSSSGSSSTGSSQSSSSTTPPAASHPVVISSTSPKGSFRAVSAMLHAPSYIITLQESLDEAGTLTWVLTFPNGPFGAYTAKSKKCRAGRIRLAGRCLPANILFGRGKQTFPAPGVVTITIKPTRSAR